MIQRYHDGESVLVPDIFMATFGNFFMKVILNERLPREKMHLLYELVRFLPLFLNFLEILNILTIYFAKTELPRMGFCLVPKVMIGAKCLVIRNGSRNFSRKCLIITYYEVQR